MITQAKKLDLIRKHAPKFVASKKDLTPIFEGVHYAQGGTAYAANRHYAFRIREAHMFPETVTSHVVTGEKIDGTYPDLEKVFPTEFKTGFTLQNTPYENQIKEALQLTKWAYEIAKANDRDNLIRLILEPSKVLIAAKYEAVEFKAIFSQYQEKEYFTVALNGEYLFNAFNLFKDAGTRVLHVRLIEKLKPVVLSDDENGIDVLIMPYRLPEVGT